MRLNSILISLLFLAAIPETALAGSPYNKYVPADKAIIGASLAGGLGMLYLRDRLLPLTELQIERLDRKNINRFDRQATRYYSKTAATISDWGMRACLALPTLIIADAKMRQDATTIALLYLETMAVVGVATDFTKVSAKRTRPYAYNADVPTKSKMAIDTRKSFFSGHTSTSFAGAVFFAKVFSDYYPNSKLKPYVWLGALSISSTVGYTRIKAGKHFPTDVLVAALVGSACGYLIPELHKKKHSGPILNLETRSYPLAVMLNFHF